MGLAADRDARRGPLRRRVRHLVRQGAGRRSLRRRAAPCQLRGVFQAWRRARADGRRPHGRILDHGAPVGIRLRRCDDADPQSRRGPGDHRLWPLRLGDVALHRRLGRAQMHARHGGIDRDRGWQPRPGENRHSRSRPVRYAARRAEHPPERQRAGAGGAALRLQARRHAGLRARQPAQPPDHHGWAQAQDRHHHHGEGLSRCAPSARRVGHRRGALQRPGPAAVQARLPVADPARRADGRSRAAST